MAYNYLSLINSINRRVNEVELISSNFDIADGFYADAKESVNASIRNINQQEYEWPFNHVEAHEDLTAGIARYQLPYDTKTVDFESFRIKRNSTFNNPTKKLTPKTYEEYLDKGIDHEYNSDTGIRQLPRQVIQAPSQEFIVYPVPDKNYELVYEYYSLPVDLELYSDVPTIPEQFKHVIVDGAMFYVHMFREDEQAAQLYQQKFTQGINYMRSIYINRYRDIRDTRIS